MRTGVCAVRTMRVVGAASLLVFAMIGVVGRASLAGAATNDVGLIAAGGTHSCAISSGHVYCWGDGTFGQLGNGTTSTQSTPVEVEGVGGTGHLSTVSALAAGGKHACAISSSHAYCWGQNTYGQLGNGTASATPQKTPVEVEGVGGTGHLSTVSALAAGTYHTCAISSSHAYCWGANSEGQLGNGTTSTQNTPVEVEDVGGTGHLSTVSALVAGGDETCAIASSHAFCWGWNKYGQLGNGFASTTPQKTPVEVEGVGGTGHLSTVSALAAGNAHTCAISSSHAYCWGQNTDGQLGNGTTTHSQTTPVEVKGVGGAGFLATVGVTTGATTTAGVSLPGVAQSAWVSALPGRSRVVTVGQISAEATGRGTVALGTYRSDPFAPLSALQPGYFGVFLTSSGHFTSLSVKDCEPGSTHVVWRDGAAWLPVNASSETTSTCTTFTFTRTSTPNISTIERVSRLTRLGAVVFGPGTGAEPSG